MAGPRCCRRISEIHLLVLGGCTDFLNSDERMSLAVLEDVNAGAKIRLIGCSHKSDTALSFTAMDHVEKEIPQSYQTRPTPNLKACCWLFLKRV